MVRCIAIDGVVRLDFIAVSAQLFHERHGVSEVLVLGAFDFHLHLVLELVPETDLAQLLEVAAGLLKGLLFVLAAALAGDLLRDDGVVGWREGSLGPTRGG